MKIFPSFNQFKRWSIPSKASFIGLLVTVISVVIAIFFHFWNPLSEKIDNYSVMLAASMRPNVIGVKVSKRNLANDGDCYYVHLQNQSNFKAREIKIEMVFREERILGCFENSIISEGRFTLLGGEEQRYPFVRADSLLRLLIDHHSGSYAFTRLHDVVLIRGDNFGPRVGDGVTKGIPFKIVVSFSSEAGESLFFEEICYAIVS